MAASALDFNDGQNNDSIQPYVVNSTKNVQTGDRY